MMNSNLTSKIVVGLGLAAAFAIGVSIFAVHAKQQQESQFALNAPAPEMAGPTSQTVADATTPAQSAATQTPADQVVIPASAPPAPAPAIAPPAGNIPKADSGTSGQEQSKPVKSKRTDRQVAKTRNADTTSATGAAFAANTTMSQPSESAPSSVDNLNSTNGLATAPSSSGITSGAKAGTTADMQQAPAQSGPESAPSTDPASLPATPAATIPAPTATDTALDASDNRITVSVKSAIATAAPNSSVEVTTTNGVVALAGSVPSHEAIIQAQEAAQRVAGVKYVDSSAMVISNQ